LTYPLEGVARTEVVPNDIAWLGCFGDE
jgi:hypothetical protein